MKIKIDGKEEIECNAYCLVAVDDKGTHVEVNGKANPFDWAKLCVELDSVRKKLVEEDPAIKAIISLAEILKEGRHDKS